LQGNVSLTGDLGSISRFIEATFDCEDQLKTKMVAVPRRPARSPEFRADVFSTDTCQCVYEGALVRQSRKLSAAPRLGTLQYCSLL
jgi:hypothetical protein